MIGGNGSLYAVLTQGDCSFEENEKWEEEIANNKAKLNETIDKIAKERSMNEDEVDALLDKIWDFIERGLTFSFTEEDIKMFIV